MISDTHPKMEQLRIDLLRELPSWRKLHMVGQMYETMKLLALSGLRQRHPGVLEAELQRRLADLWLGTELAVKVFGPLEIG